MLTHILHSNWAVCDEIICGMLYRLFSVVSVFIGLRGSFEYIGASL